MHPGARTTSNEGLPRRVTSQRTALLVVDMQVCLLDRRGAMAGLWASLLPEDAALYFERIERTVVPNIERLLERSRALALHVVFTALGSAREDGGDLARWARRHNALWRRLVGAATETPASDAGWRIHDALRPARGEPVLARTTTGALASTPLEARLRGLGVDTVLLAGVATNGSVTDTARELAGQGFRTLIVEDACAALGESRHCSALETFSGAAGLIATTAGLLATLPRPAAGAA